MIQVSVWAHVLFHIQFAGLSSATLDLQWRWDSGYKNLKKPKMTVLEQTKKMETKGSCSGRRGTAGMSWLSFLQLTELMLLKHQAGEELIEQTAKVGLRHQF